MAGVSQRARAIFQPVILLDQTEPADKFAVGLINSLQADIAETMDTERNRQTIIGPSGVGNPCNKCVARALAQVPRQQSTNWKAQVGTFIHAGLEQHFSEKYGNASSPFWESDHDGPPPVPTDGEPLYHTEIRLHILDHKSLHLGGNCDLYVEGANYGVVVDWKSRNTAGLKEATSGKVKPINLVQMNIYGLGVELQGRLVTHLCMYALPRDGDLEEARPVLMRYDRQIAVDALNRLTTMIDAAEILEAAYPGHGWEMFIRAQDTASGCWDCKPYEQAESGSLFDGMFGDQPNQKK